MRPSGFRLVRCGAALAATSLALSRSPSAEAAEPWPPSTPPRVDLGAEPSAPPAPAPVELEPARPAPPPVASKEGATVVIRAPEPPSTPLARYGSTDGQLYLRTARDGLELLPTARLELDARAIATDEQNASQQTAKLALARLEVAAWLGPIVYADLSADFASGPSLRRADDYLAVAPWNDWAILEVGQFDAPFTLENRTAERYLALGDRGAAVRAFAIPRNKAEGAMIHGTNPARNFYYSAGVFDGAGPGETAANGQVDVMARGWVAPFSFRDPELLRDVTVGGSLWTGNRSYGGAGASFDAPATAAGYTLLDPTLWTVAGTPRALAVRQDGRLDAVALELDAPIAHRYGARFEWIWKRQSFAAVEVGGTRPMRVGDLSLSGFATYLEVWGWVLGDERLLGPPAAPGLELPLRLRDFPSRPPASGLMVAARVDFVDEDLSADARGGAAQLGVAGLGKTKLTALTLGASYWYTRRARLLLSYVFNHLDGDTPYVMGLDASNEHEILLRTALAL